MHLFLHSAFPEMGVLQYILIDIMVSCLLLIAFLLWWVEAKTRRLLLFYVIGGLALTGSIFYRSHAAVPPAPPTRPDSVPLEESCQFRGEQFCPTTVRI